jgi:hypothetical protein
VLVIRIEPFPPEEDPSAGTRLASLYEVVGPISTIQNVRVASQAERNSYDFRLLAEAEEANEPSWNYDARVERNKALAQATQSKTNSALFSRGPGRDPAQHDAVQIKQGEAMQQGKQYEQQAAAAERELLSEKTITQVTFRFLEGEEEVPLSWKLTRKQRAAIESAWQKVVETKVALDNSNGLSEPPLCTVDRFFKRLK